MFRQKRRKPRQATKQQVTKHQAAADHQVSGSSSSHSVVSKNQSAFEESSLALPEALRRNYSIDHAPPQLVSYTSSLFSPCTNVARVLIGGAAVNSVSSGSLAAPSPRVIQGSPHAAATKKPLRKQSLGQASKRKRSTPTSAKTLEAATGTWHCLDADAAADGNLHGQEDTSYLQKTQPVLRPQESNNDDQACLKSPNKSSASTRQPAQPRRQRLSKTPSTAVNKRSKSKAGQSKAGQSNVHDNKQDLISNKKAATRKRRRTKSDKNLDKHNEDDVNEDRGDATSKTLPIFAPTTARSRADLERFAQTKVDILMTEYLSNVQALRQKLEALLIRSKSMTARHEIHARRDVDAQVTRVEHELAKLESGNVLRSFKQEAACVLLAYDTLLLEQSSCSSSSTDQHVSVPAGAAFVACAPYNEEEDLATTPFDDNNDAAAGLSKAPILEDFSNTKRQTTHTNDGNNSDEAIHQNTKTDEESSSLVAEEDSGSVIERRRHVSKPDMRVLTKGQNHAAAVADSFLERNGGLVTKPMCCISDTHCIQCQGQLVLDVLSDLFVCVDCHFEQSTTHSSEHSMGYGNTSSVTFNSCRYTRETHFINYLDRFGGCVGSEKITDELVVSVMKWMKDRGVAADAVSAQIVNLALHDLGYRELKQHKVIIMARITGVKPKSFSPEQRTQLIDMFRQVSRAFDELRRKGRFPHRVNFLSYRYTIFKFLEMLTWGEEFKASFEVLKGPGNLENQDEYWKCICDYLGFHFIPTEPLVQIHIDLLSPRCPVCFHKKKHVCASCHN